MQLTTDWTQIEVVQLLNDGSGLGFGIIGSKSTGVVVKTILPGGPADRVRLNILLSSTYPAFSPSSYSPSSHSSFPFLFACLIFDDQC